MGANRAGDNRRRKQKRQIKNLTTKWAAEDRAAAGRQEEAKSQRRPTSNRESSRLRASSMHGIHATSRRAFLVASTLGFAGLQFGRPAGQRRPKPAAGTGRGGKAKSTILFFLCGGSSHIDTWDMKPDAPLEYRGPFQPIATTAPGIRLCEHLPLLAKQAHHLALVRSVGASVNTNDHHAGYYYNLTGHAADPTFLSLGNNRTPYADDWPFMGTVVAAKRPPHAYLPNAITLPHKPSKAPYTRPGQFAARLGVEHDPLYLEGSLEQPLKFSAPSLELQQGMTGARVAARRELLARHGRCPPAVRRRRTNRNLDAAARTGVRAAGLVAEPPRRSTSRRNPKQCAAATAKTSTA